MNLAISRIKFLRNKREVQLKKMRQEIAQFLQTGQEAIARIRVRIEFIGIMPHSFRAFLFALNCIGMNSVHENFFQVVNNEKTNG